MPYHTFPPDIPTSDVWSAQVTRMSDDFLAGAWTAWAILAGVAGLANALVILIVVLSKQLRQKQFNKLFIGLAFPDFLFSATCSVSCSTHRYFRRFYGGNLHCDIQGLYVTFGFAASIWMNVVIASEIYRMATCAHIMEPYVPLSNKSISCRVGLAYLISLFLGALHYIPGVPLTVNAEYGLACVPLSYDRDSTIFFWLFFAPALLLVPLLSVVWYFCRTFFILRKIKQSKDAQESRALLNVFFRLLVALVLFWLPTAVFMWIFGTGILAFVGGTISHMQGVASAFIYCRKPDISSEIKSWVACLACRGKIANEQTGTNQEGLGQASFGKAVEDDNESDDVPSDEGLQFSGTAYEQEAETFVFLDVLTGFDEESPFEVHASVRSSEFTSKSTITASLLRRIKEKEETPMMVVPFSLFIAHGRIPSSIDGLQRRVEESDTVVFVSHRWWGSSEPDDNECRKYGLICRGVASIAKQFQSLYLESNSLAIWIDYACIDQVNESRRQQGIASLFSYVARSDFLFIPVFPSPEATGALNNANHPFELINYGERAWCRLEVYVFLCVCEIFEKPLHCFAYGRRAVVPASRKFMRRYLPRIVDERVPSLVGFSSSLFTQGEGLKRIGVTNGGATFTYDYLPSNGELTDENDRNGIQCSELAVRIEYSQAVLARAMHSMRQTHKGILSLASKQLSSWDVPFLVNQLTLAPLHSLREVNMTGNMLTSGGAAQLITVLVGGVGDAVESLDFSNNRLEARDAHKLRDALLSLSRPLQKLILRGNSLGVGATEVIAGARKVTDLLDLSENQIHDVVAIHIANLFRNEPVGARCVTQILRLRLNGITTRAAEEILAAGIVVIDLAGNPISQDVFATAALRQASAMV